MSETEKPETADIPDGDQNESPENPDVAADHATATDRTGGLSHRGLLIGVSTVAVIATVLAVVFGVLWGQASSKADKNADTASVLQARQDSYAKAIAVATEFTTTRTTTPANGDWAGWQAKMRSLVGPGMQDRYSDGNVAKVKAVNLKTVTTVPYAGVTVVTNPAPDTISVLLVTRTAAGSGDDAQVLPGVQIVTVDSNTDRVTNVQ